MTVIGGEPAFTVIAGSAESSVVLHVPHSSVRIPADVRVGIALDDTALAAELLRMTDAHTDRIAQAAADAVTPRPWVVVNRMSRLVVDPERFPDGREEMLAALRAACRVVPTGVTSGRTLPHHGIADRGSPSGVPAGRRLGGERAVRGCLRMGSTGG